VRQSDSPAGGFDQNALASARQEINCATSLQDAFRVVETHALKLTEADGCAFFEFLPATNTLTCSLASAGAFQKFRGHTIQPGQRVTGWVWANRQTISNANAALELGDVFDVLPEGRLGAISTTVSAHSGHELIGVLTAYASGAKTFGAGKAYAFESLSVMLGEFIAKTSTINARN
jgi:hypothetical protein